jgi:TonB family protein
MIAVVPPRILRLMMKASLLLAVVLATLLIAASPAEDTNEVTRITEHSGDRKSLHTVVPVYPKRALRDRIQGDVEVCFDVDRDGRTSRIAVRRSSNKVFEKVAREAVQRSTYVAVPADLALSGIKTCRTFRFRLDPEAVSESEADPDDESGGSEP